LDDIDWHDEIRLVLEKRASLSPMHLTGMEANLRSAAPRHWKREFRSTVAWQNWIFIRPMPWERWRVEDFRHRQQS